MEGWIKLHRKSIENGWLLNANLWVFWTYCLMKATHKKHKTMIGFQQVELVPGQFIFGRKIASKETGLSEQTIRTCLGNLKKVQNLTIKSTNKYSIITVVNWDSYQQVEEPVNQQTNQRVTSNQPATNQQLTTDKNVKTVKNEKTVKNLYPVKPIIEHLNKTTGSKYMSTTKKTIDLVKARTKEGFTTEDFKTVINKKWSDWKDTEYAKFVRPETLFGTKFEGYLNQIDTVNQKQEAEPELVFNKV